MDLYVLFLSLAAGDTTRGLPDFDPVLFQKVDSIFYKATHFHGQQRLKV